MERELINLEYLNELMSVAQDQKENELISQLFRNLINNKDNFLREFSSLTRDENSLKFEIHKLKNQFANLGCEAATAVLEIMYQNAKSNRMDLVRSDLTEFSRISDETLQKLRLEIGH